MLKKIQLLVVPLFLQFLSLVKQTGMTEMPSPSSNSNNSNMSSTRNMTAKEVVGSYVFILNIHLEINCISCN